MSASYSFSLFSRCLPFFPTQEDLQKCYYSPLVFCLSLPSARRHGLFSVFLFIKLTNKTRRSQYGM